MPIKTQLPCSFKNFLSREEVRQMVNPQPPPRPPSPINSANCAGIKQVTMSEILRRIILWRGSSSLLRRECLALSTVVDGVKLNKLRGTPRRGGKLQEITNCILYLSSGTFNQRRSSTSGPSRAGALCCQRHAIASDNIYAPQLQKKSKQQTREYDLNLGRH